MLSIGVQNSRSNSLELGGYDRTQVATKMTKEAKDKHMVNSHLNEQFKTPPEELGIN